MKGDFQVEGKNAAALFTLKLHRGDGMTLIAMNWKKGLPSKDFVGFAIEYQEPGGDRFFSLKNRLSFTSAAGALEANSPVDQAFTDPEIPLGAFSPQRRTCRRIRLPGHPGLHERCR